MYYGKCTRKREEEREEDAAVMLAWKIKWEEWGKFQEVDVTPYKATTRMDTFPYPSNGSARMPLGAKSPVWMTTIRLDPS